MTTLKELAPKLLEVIEDAQSKLSRLQDMVGDDHLYEKLELLSELNDLINEVPLIQLVQEVRESLKPSSNPFEKYWPESSMIEKTEYEPNNNVLVITFKNGSKYAYQDFPADKWEETKASESIGKYVNSAIKGTYTSQKLETVNGGGAINETKGSNIRSADSDSPVRAL